MCGMLCGVSDTDEIKYCPFCQQEVSAAYADGTVECGSCGRRFGVIEADPEDEENEKE